MINRRKHKAKNKILAFFLQKILFYGKKYIPLQPMNELSRHIESLLLSHDCVVVPQFGGFVTMATSATREETEQLFFPPIRVVRFNPDLMEDDGLLTTAVREWRHCTSTEAKRYIQLLVLDLRQQLLSDGQVDFGSMGVFSQDEDGRVSFSPCQAGVVTPDFFGLDAFLMQKLTAAQRSGHRRGSSASQLAHDASHDSQHITIHISKRGLKNIVAAAAIILLCALFSTPLDNAVRSNQASVLPSEPSTELPAAKPAKPQQPAVVKEKAVKESAVTPEVKPEQVKVEAEKVAPVTQTDATSNELQPAGNYCIVLASNVSRKNAERYVQTLRQRGFSNARVYNNGKMNRVIIDGFQTEEQATAENIKLHHTDSEYATTWVMAL